jgi:hypothetical protein
MENIHNSFYYTFSTIAQVLSGFLGLSGVFVLFKLQELKKMQLGEAKKFMERIEEFLYPVRFTLNSAKLDTAFKAESIPDIIHEMSSLLKEAKPDNMSLFNYLKEKKDKCIKINAKKSKIVNLTRVSFFTGIVAILFSIIILSFTHLIESNYYIFFISGISLTFVTIVLMLSVILKSIKE